MLFIEMLQYIEDFSGSGRKTGDRSWRPKSEDRRQKAEATKFPLWRG